MINRLTLFSSNIKETDMNIDKSTKRLTKMLNKGFQGYPKIELEYFGETAECATEVSVKFILDEGVAAQEEKFSSTSEIRKDEGIQTTLIKIIERAGAKTVTLVENITIIK